MIPGGERALLFDRAVGPVRLSCTGHGAAEPAVELLVVGSPFVARTDADGRFAFEGVPAGALRIATGTDEAVEVPVTVSAGQTAELELRTR